MTQSCPNISLTQFKKPIRDCTHNNRGKNIKFRLIFLNIILASTKSDNPLYIYVDFCIKIYLNRPPCPHDARCWREYHILT
ncbi:hypothetical protein BpHYR1_000965 [Brachionus plicatilis]|uniref:Uncharacterized protein n=1 Tax=Brachionus plicatilis TaxID=10195 RepID=A0A3M7QEW6_BRAPC|nr:hypothetical protein BpHYR1_000965 [Brachionus plicatilis]